jgi:hypothetical protein
MVFSLFGCAEMQQVMNQFQTDGTGLLNISGIKRSLE